MGGQAPGGQDPYIRTCCTRSAPPPLLTGLVAPKVIGKPRSTFELDVSVSFVKARPAACSQRARGHKDLRSKLLVWKGTLTGLFRRVQSLALTQRGMQPGHAPRRCPSSSGSSASICSGSAEVAAMMSDASPRRRAGS